MVLKEWKQFTHQRMAQSILEDHTQSLRKKMSSFSNCVVFVAFLLTWKTATLTLMDEQSQANSFTSIPNKDLMTRAGIISQ